MDEHVDRNDHRLTTRRRFGPRPEAAGSRATLRQWRGASSLLALLLVSLLAAEPAALAQQGVDTSTRDALEQEIAEYERLLQERNADIARIQQELGGTATTLQARIADRDAVSSNISSLRTERSALQAAMAQLELDLAATAAEIDRILGDLASLQDRISALLVNLYTQRSSRYARVLSEATSYHNLQVRAHYLSLLTQQDVDLVNELDRVRLALLEAQARQSDQLAEHAAAEDRLRANEENLVQQQASLQGIIGELESTQAGQRAQQQALLQAQNEIESAIRNLGNRLEAEIRRLQEEEARLQREAAQAFLDQRQRDDLLQEAEQTRELIDNLTAPLLPASTDFGWPVASPTIYSSFGFQNNSYLALRADRANAPVVAIEAGVVFNVMNLSANDGYLVVIRHGNELLVSYTNLQVPVVRAGQYVAKGELLGYLGGGALVDADVLKLWVMVGSTFVDPQARLGY